MNEVTKLICAGELAKQLPPGEWIFCWMEFEDMFVVFCEKHTGVLFKGFYNIERGFWLETPPAQWKP